MPFETPITIRETIQRIHAREYLLPGIQREFVWEPDQICRLFDSLVRGYPIGSFLFWRVTEEHKADYKFYEFLRDYHEHDLTHNPKASLLPAGGLTAVLDGQQRLTSLYIGLMGTHTTRRKYARKGAVSSYARRRLYLNLAHPAPGDEAFFDFKFHEADDKYIKEGDDFWFRVGDILAFQRTTDVFDFLIEHGLTQSKHPKTCLVELHRTITELPLINYFTEVEQDLDRVLNIFIRVNSGGTPLSYSDLLLSIASAQWEERDAREAIHTLVDEINGEYGDFAFPRDFVLKSCLMLADVDLRWKVANFNHANMQRIEALWPSIEQAIRLAVETVSGFGFTGKTLASTNAVIPIVYYLFQRRNPPGFAESAAFRADRESIQRWLNIVLLKRVFGGVPDNVLRRIREVIRSNHGEFPSVAITEDLETTPYALSFRPSELEMLLDGRYGGQYTFPLLAMLYPTLDFRHKLHQDHIHPRSHFTIAQLKKRGIPDELHEQYMARVDLIPNLQLLEGQPNIEKSATPFAEWLTAVFPESEKRSDFVKRHFIPGVEHGFDHFLDFFARRRTLLLEALRHLVGLSSAPEVEDLQQSADDEVASFHAECVRRVGRALGAELVRETQTCYASGDKEQRAVCLVSKRYERGQQGRYWFAFRPHHVEFLDGAHRGWVALGCGGPELTVMIPGDRFLPTLRSMRQTEEDDGHSYWHVECFGDAKHLELGQPSQNGRIDVTSLLLTAD
jgi:hypothetical protein